MLSLMVSRESAALTLFCSPVHRASRSFHHIVLKPLLRDQIVLVFRDVTECGTNMIRKLAVPCRESLQRLQTRMLARAHLTLSGSAIRLNGASSPADICTSQRTLMMFLFAAPSSYVAATPRCIFTEFVHRPRR